MPSCTVSCLPCTSATSGTGAKSMRSGAAGILTSKKSGSLLRPPESVTTSCTVYVPTTSATNVGVLVLALESVAALPGGKSANDQSYCSSEEAVLSSDDPLPSRITASPNSTVWSMPAYAVGAAFGITSKKSGSLLRPPESVTTSRTVYVPTTSATNVYTLALHVALPISLPGGKSANDQSYCSSEEAVLSSDDPLPSRITTSPNSTVWSMPAYAVGAAFGRLASSQISEPIKNKFA